MRLAHGGHSDHWVREVCQRGAHRQVRRHVVIDGFRAFLFQGAETLVLVLLLLAEVDDRVTLLARLVGAAVPGDNCQL